MCPCCDQTLSFIYSNTLQRYIPPLEVQFTVPIAALPPVALSPNACQQLIGVIVVAIDNYLRTPLILISRRPRVGNTIILEKVKKVIDDHKAHFNRNSLVLFVPTEAKLQLFDGFCVRYQDGELCNVCGYQCKDNNSGAYGLVPSWITEGGHLLRSDAPKTCREVGQNSMRWTYYNAEDTDDFLGWSLRIMRG